MGTPCHFFFIVYSARSFFSLQPCLLLFNALCLCVFGSLSSFIVLSVCSLRQYPHALVSFVQLVLNLPSVLTSSVLPSRFFLVFLFFLLFSFLPLSSIPLLFLSSLAFLFFFPFTSARHSSSLLLFLFLFTPSLPPQAPFTSFHRIIFSSHLLSSHLLLLPSSTCPYSLVPLLIPFSHLTIPLRLIIRSSSLHLTIQGNHPQPCHSPFLVHIHLSKLRPLVPYKSHTKTKSCVGYLCSPDGRTVCSRRWRLSCSCSQSNRSTPLDQVSNCILLPRSYILLSDFITAHLLQMLVRFICA